VRLGLAIALGVFALIALHMASGVVPSLPPLLSTDGVLRLAYALAAGGLMVLLLMQVAELFRANQRALVAQAEAARKEAELNAALFASERQYAEAVRKASGFQRRLEITAHDIRQPLAALRGFLDRTGRGAPDHGAMLDALGYLEGIATGTPREPERLDEAPYKADVVLKAVQQMLQKEAQDRRMTVTVDADPDAMTETPALALMRIVSNLAVNALKHSGGSYVRLEATAQHITIRNDGAVLTAEAFESYLASGVKGAASDGDGLGLSIVADLVKEAGLTLSLDTSNPTETAIVVGL
ncbi:MAG: HAMP domain-containing sensor histidine kinase, partial [Pseudomonadota bacterium]